MHRPFGYAAKYAAALRVTIIGDGSRFAERLFYPMDTTVVRRVVADLFAEWARIRGLMSFTSSFSYFLR